jgi:maltose O-acetyltransferase
MSLIIGVLRKALNWSEPLYERVLDSRNRKNCDCAQSARFYRSAVVYNSRTKESIKIDENTHIRGELNLFPNGESIKIGKYCYIGDSTRIWAMSSITIGDRVLISHGVNIHDNNAHSLSATDRHQHFTDIFERGHPKILTSVAVMPVHIEDDVWIGFNATLLKGVRIGKGSIVGACTVVTKDVPPFSIVVGNPSRIVGSASA